MPTTVADLTWHVASGITILLITAIGVIVWWGFRRMIDKMDLLTVLISETREAAAVDRTSLDAHIHNEGMHCKGANCQAFR